MSSPAKAGAVTRSRKAQSRMKPPIKKAKDVGQVRKVIHAQFQEGAAKGQDIDALKESLGRRFNDPAALSAIEEEYTSAKAAMGQGDNAPEGQQKRSQGQDTQVNEEQQPPAGQGGEEAIQREGQAEKDKVDEEGKAAGGDEEAQGQKAPEGSETGKGKGGEVAQGGEQATGKGPQGEKEQGGTKGGSDGKTSPEAGKGKHAGTGTGLGKAAGSGGKGVPPAMQDIGVAATPGQEGKLPSFSESLSVDLQKYASEKAWHDAWNLHGRQNLGGQMPQVEKPGVSFGDRAALLGKALAKGAGCGFVRGVGELAISLLIQQGSKKVPYLSGFVEIAQIALDPKGWFNANKDATAGKLSKGWSDAFGAGKDWVTRIEGIINLLDGVANVVGLLGTICQKSKNDGRRKWKSFRPNT